MKTSDDTTTIQELKTIVAAFRDERDWKKHHTPKNLSMSIAIEAAELMELFQWDDYGQTSLDDIADELSDILIYSFNLAQTLDIDIASRFRDKLHRAELKYPVETFNAHHDDPADYVRIKKNYRAKKGKETT